MSDRTESSPYVDPERVAAVEAGRASAHTLAATAAIFKALGDPTRAQILHLLSIRELCVGDLAQLVALSQSAVSHQLRLLRSLRLVGSRREGQHVYYHPTDEHVAAILETALAHADEPRD